MWLLMVERKAVTGLRAVGTSTLSASMLSLPSLRPASFSSSRHSQPFSFLFIAARPRLRTRLPRTPLIATLAPQRPPRPARDSSLRSASSPHTTTTTPTFSFSSPSTACSLEPALDSSDGALDSP